MPLSEVAAGKPSLAEKAMEYMDRNSSRKFSLCEIAEHLYINPYYLARLFKKETGHTLLWYHNAVRCEKAARLLCRGEKTVSEAGDAVGFVSSAHFSNVFKRITGMSPSEFRENPSDNCFRELYSCRRG